MSYIDDALIVDVRALLAAFRGAGLGRFSATLRDGVELTLIRDQSPAGTGRSIFAPHIASIAKVTDAEGLAGGITLELLGDEIFLPFGDGEIVEKLLVKVGDLVEFGSELARLR